MDVLTEVVQRQCLMDHKKQKPNVQFLAGGGRGGRQSQIYRRQSEVHTKIALAQGECTMEVDLRKALRFPDNLCPTAQTSWYMVRRRHVLHSVILAELTVPRVANAKWAHERKARQYWVPKHQIEDNGWKMPSAFSGGRLLRFYWRVHGQVPDCNGCCTVHQTDHHQEAPRNAGNSLWLDLEWDPRIRVNCSHDIHNFSKTPGTR